MIRYNAFSFVLVALLTACVTPTPYGPAENGRGYGFSEQRLDEDRYRLDFCGNSFTSRETVETFLLLRAAEITLDRGYDYFVITESDVDSRLLYSDSIDHPVFYTRSSYGVGRKRIHYEFPYYPDGYDWAPRANQHVTESVSYTAIAYITMYRGSKSTDDKHTFDAREVYDSLKARAANNPG